MVKTVLLACFSILLVGAIILQPDAAFQSSLQGLTVWWNIVFPGLLPFLVLFELIAAFGLTHAIGTLLQPAMGKLFKLPGEAALAVVMGWTVGYPTGAEAVASLRKRNLVSKKQGQRLLALAHMPNPLFMLVVIGAGFLHRPIVGAMIAASVWLSALWLTLIISLFSRDTSTNSTSNDQLKAGKKQLSVLHRAAEALHLGREQDGRSFGKALGDAVASSVQRLLVIGGLMIFAAVIAKLADPLLAPLLSRAGLTFLSQAFFEGHLGAYAAAVWDAPGTSTLTNAAAIAAVLAWSGFSGILQADYAINGTDLKLLPFVAMRLAHAVHAFLFMVLLWKPLTALLHPILASGEEPVFVFTEPYPINTSGSAAVRASDLPLLWQYSIGSCILLLLSAMIITLIIMPFRRSRSQH